MCWRGYLVGVVGVASACERADPPPRPHPVCEQVQTRTLLDADEVALLPHTGMLWQWNSMSSGHRVLVDTAAMTLTISDWGPGMWTPVVTTRLLAQIDRYRLVVLATAAWCAPRRKLEQVHDLHELLLIGDGEQVFEHGLPGQFLDGPEGALRAALEQLGGRVLGHAP